MVNVVQLGAHEGKSDSDAIWPQIRFNNWRGLFVEPLPTSFKKLKQYYSDTHGNCFEQVAIVAEVSEEPLKLYYNESCTTSASLNKGWHKNGHDGVTFVLVQSMTLQQLLEKHNLIGVPFDLLQIDIEGNDVQVIQSTDFTNILPKYIRIETIHAGTKAKRKMTEYLQKWDYNIVDDPFYEEYSKNTTSPESKNYNTVYRRGEE